MIEHTDPEVARLVAEATSAHRDPLGELLDDVRDAYTRLVVYPSPAHADAVTLYTAATHAQDVWEHATRLIFESPVKKCGKTRSLEILRELAWNPIVAANASVAVLVHSIDEHDPPTIILDEADTIFGTRRGERSESAEDLRGILNAGHSRGWPYLRWDVKRREREECATFAMAALGAIGGLPDTIEDRAVIISMRRRAPGESVESWRRRRVVPRLRALGERLHAGVRARVDELREVEPELPVEDRAADCWEPLVALADVAGGTWPDRARRACLVLNGEDDLDDATAGERLLADLEAVWGDEPHIPTAELLPRLYALEESPWGEWYGRQLTARDLARLLRPYGIKSKTVRTGAALLKGYTRDDLEDPWSRYTRPSATSDTATQAEGFAPMTSENGRVGYVSDGISVSDTRSDQQDSADVSDVSDVADVRLELATVDAESNTPEPLDLAEIATIVEDTVAAHASAGSPTTAAAFELEASGVTPPYGRAAWTGALIERLLREETR